MSRKTNRMTEHELARERWQRSASLAGMSLSELMTTATNSRVAEIERDHAANLVLDESVRRQVDAAIAERSSVTCVCERCR